MNEIYWLVVGVLLLVSFSIVLPPLWKKREVKEAEFDQLNIKIAQDRVNDLKQQLQASTLTKAQFDEQYAEIELNLGDDLDIEQHKTNTASQGRWVIPLIVIAFPLFSILTYFQLGEPDALIKEQAQSQRNQQTESSKVDVNAMVAGLAERLMLDPENAEGWLMLGRSYKYLKKYPLAINAFDKAYALLGDRPDVMLQYADALAMANDGKLSGKPSELIFKALEKSPNDITGLWLGGMAKAEMGEFSQAMQYLRKLEKLLAPGSQSYQEIQQLISSIQGQSSADIAPPLQATLNEAVSIEVYVEVADSLKNKITPQDTVFIYAKALTGSPMPLAIERKQVADLPLSVSLDDTMAMMPAMKLSNFDQVKVLARISKSGTAMQQKGDFIGTVAVQKLVGKVAVTVVINEEIK